MENYQTTCIAVCAISLMIGFVFGITMKKHQFGYVEYSDEPLEVGDTVVHKSKEDIRWVVKSTGLEGASCYRYIGTNLKRSDEEIFKFSELLKIKTK